LHSHFGQREVAQGGGVLVEHVELVVEVIPRELETGVFGGDHSHALVVEVLVAFCLLNLNTCDVDIVTG